MRSRHNVVPVACVSDTQSVEVGYCAICRSIVDITTDGPTGYGRAIERCTNPRCLGSLPHACQPEPRYRAPKDPSDWQLGIARSQSHLAKMARTRAARLVTEAARQQTGLDLGVRVAFTSIGQ